MALTETILQSVGLIPLLLGFAEHLGKQRLKRLEDTVKAHLTPRGFCVLPWRVFKQSFLALTRNEALMTVIVLLFVGLFFYQPNLSTIKDLYFKMIVCAGWPVRWLGRPFGFVGEILGIPLAVLVAVVFGFLLPMFVFLVLFTILILVLLYPLLGLLTITSWCKRHFGLSGSIIKITSFGLAFILYTMSLVLKFVSA